MSVNIILDGAIQSFIRYGVKKTSMSDIAKEAGISRPTLYASFKNKDQVLAEVIRYVSRKGLDELGEQWKNLETLDEKLDALFEIMVVAGYDLVQQSPDAEDLQHGFSEAGRAAVREVRFWYRDALIDVLEPYEGNIKSTGQTVEQFAYFIVSAAKSIKHAVASREELLELLESLKVAVLAVTTKAPS